MSSDEEIEGEGAGGEGKDSYPYGEYEGGRDDKNERHGFGSALLPNGDIYEGNYAQGKRHGLGMYCFKNGARYHGEWRKGMKHGHGIFYYPDGSRYVGSWRRDNKHGHGTYYYANGDTYEGNYYLNQRVGLGTYTYSGINVSFYGLWTNGQINGPGIIRYVPYRYHGSFEKNLPKGPGCFTFDGRYMLHGYYVNLKDPAFDYVGAAELELEENKPKAETESHELPKGIVPIWRSRYVTEYKEDLLPPEPTDFPRHESSESIIDIIDYLQKQYMQERVYQGEGEEDHKLLPSPVPVDLMIDDIDGDPPPAPPGSAAEEPTHIDV